MGKKPEKTRKRRGKFADLVSIVLVARDESETMVIPDSVLRLAGPVWVAVWNHGDPPIGRDRRGIPLRPRGDGSFWLPADPIATPWVLILEEGEFIAPAEIKALRALVDNPPETSWLAGIQRFVSTDELSQFEWVGSVGFPQAMGAVERSFYTLEPRLVPREALEHLRLFPGKILDHARPMDHECHPGRPSNVTISRLWIGTDEGGDEPPEDREIFLAGHGAHFDDTRFSWRFAWPGISYQTLRYEHIAGIEIGLEEGWGTPDMTAQAIAYLIRFGHYEQAHRLATKVPEAWTIEHAHLSQMAGLAALTCGRRDEASRALELSATVAPNDWIGQLNLSKMRLLLGQDEEALRTLKEAAQAIHDDQAQAERLQSLAAAIERNRGKRASLSLCLVVRDEQEYLPQCLASVRGLADEIIVVDTGSMDRTREIARDFGATIYEIPWQDDFAAARNFALNKATSDYVFMLDADEYISPHHILNLHVLKALLPVHQPTAFRFTVAHVQTRHNWLVYVRAINPRVEGESVRIFPRLPDLRYTGPVEEEVESALSARGVPISEVSSSDVYILHEPTSRETRIHRKLPIYDRIQEISPRLIVAAIRDYSGVGEIPRLISRLERLRQAYGTQPWAWSYSLTLARYLEGSEPARAEAIYREILRQDQNHLEAQAALAGFLVRTSRLEELRTLSLPDPERPDEMEPGERLTYRTYQALRGAITGEVGLAALYLDQVLSENPIFLLGQAARFYVLVQAGDIRGAIFSVSDILAILGESNPFVAEDIPTLVGLLERVCEEIQKRQAHQEQKLIVAGALLLEQQLLGQAALSRDGRPIATESPT